ncbi:lipoprotein [Klebsiella variicola]|nr:lipoprotein [Klebsiella variicola]
MAFQDTIIGMSILNGKKNKASHKEHSALVPVPDYNGQKTCGIKIHFLPCDKVKVTTSCYDYGNPNYPIKDPIKMEEPEVCAK